MGKKEENRQTGGETPVFCAVEEHAQAMRVSAPVFAAVMQAQGWAEGKKVERTAFETAVKAFLNGPAGGVKHGVT